MNVFVRGFFEDENHELYVLTSRKSGPDPAAARGDRETCPRMRE